LGFDAGRSPPHANPRNYEFYLSGRTLKNWVQSFYLLFFYNVAGGTVSFRDTEP
jgi:hypothetical protein